MTLPDSIIESAQRLGQLLQQRGWTISCAESCTGGGIGYAITSISGSSGWFQRGFITYADAAKIEVLGVSRATLATDGAVSADTVAEMAKGAQERADSQVAIAVSGVAGPNGGTPEKPVGLVWFGLAIEDQLWTWSERLEGDRHQVRQGTVQMALDAVIHSLNKE